MCPGSTGVLIKIDPAAIQFPGRPGATKGNSLIIVDRHPELPFFLPPWDWPNGTTDASEAATENWLLVAALAAANPVEMKIFVR